MSDTDSRKTVSTPRAPAAVGPYSQGVMAGGFLFVSGQIGLDPETKRFTGTTASDQAHRAMLNVGAILEEAGFSFSDIVKTTVLLYDIRDFKEVNDVYARFFKEPYPARAAYQAANFPLEALVEIEVIAFKH